MGVIKELNKTLGQALKKLTEQKSRVINDKAERWQRVDGVSYLNGANGKEAPRWYVLRRRKDNDSFINKESAVIPVSCLAVLEGQRMRIIYNLITSINNNQSELY